MINETTEFGKRVNRRLLEERTIWLTTVSPDRTPQPRPVWFYWDNESFIRFSRPGTFKLKHIRSNPKVALNFDGDRSGGDIVVILGEAQIDEEVPPANELTPYTEKYEFGFRRLNMTAEQFAKVYSVVIRVKPYSSHGH